jgi:hypothetical protein
MPRAAKKIEADIPEPVALVEQKPKRVRRPRASAAVLSEVTPTITALADVIPPSPKGEEKRVIRRKAPTRKVSAPVAEAPDLTATERREQTHPRARKPVSWSVVMVCAVVLFGASLGVSAAVGMTDVGAINVNEKLQAHAHSRTPNQGSDGTVESQTIPVQTTPVTVPNGGLIGAGNPPPTPPVATEPATTTATSSVPVEETDVVAAPTSTVATATPATSE